MFPYSCRNSQKDRNRRVLGTMTQLEDVTDFGQLSVVPMSTGCRMLKLTRRIMWINFLSSLKWHVGQSRCSGREEEYQEEAHVVGLIDVFCEISGL